MSLADLFASTEFDSIDSRSLDWLTPDHVQVIIAQMEQQSTRKTALLTHDNEFCTSFILSDTEENVLMLL